jgi:CheY-like chemotaxis protein
MKKRSDLPKRILLVDDDPKLAIVVSRGLKLISGECIVETANDTNGALTKLEQQPYDLLITDYNMPKATGLTLAKEVRLRWPEIYIILMTAYGTPQLRQQTEDIELDGYITKPFNLNTLRGMVNGIVNKKS